MTPEVSPGGRRVGQPNQISSYSNVAVCPNEWSTMDINDQSYRLEVLVKDKEGRTAKKTAMVTPYCAESDKEERPPIAGALAASLERRGIQVAHAPTDEAAVNVAAQMRPNLVVMDAMQVRTRRAGIIDWLRVNGLLSRTPFVIYTSADMNPADLPRLATGETVRARIRLPSSAIER